MMLPQNICSGSPWRTWKWLSGGFIPRSAKLSLQLWLDNEVVFFFRVEKRPQRAGRERGKLVYVCVCVCVCVSGGTRGINPRRAASVGFICRSCEGGMWRGGFGGRSGVHVKISHVSSDLCAAFESFKPGSEWKFFPCLQHLVYLFGFTATACFFSARPPE